MRARRSDGLLVVEALDEGDVLLVGGHRRQARTDLHCLAGALGPPVGGLDAVGEVDHAEAHGRPVRIAGAGSGGRFGRRGQPRLHPRQREGDARAAQEAPPRRLPIDAIGHAFHGVPRASRLLHSPAPMASRAGGSASCFPRRLRNCSLVTMPMVRSANVASPPDAASRSINGRSDAITVRPSAKPSNLYDIVPRICCSFRSR